MITPAHTLTASERVLPRLALDFTTAVLDPRVTVTRSGNTATVTNSNGSVSIVNADLPRFDYVNGVCRGLLIEESRANLLLNSVFGGAVAGTPGTAPTNWIDLQVTGTISSVSAGLYAAGNAVRITNVATRRAFYRSQSVSANTTYSYRITVTVHSTASVGYPRIRDCMNLSGGPTGSTVTLLLNGASATLDTAIPDGQTSTVVAIIAVGATAGSVEVRWGLGVTSAIDADVTLQMPQFEVGAFPTSYIPTTTTSLTRNADVVSMTGTNFSDWYNATEGTFVANFIPYVVGSYTVFSATNNSFNNRIQGEASNAVQFLVGDGGPGNIQAFLDAGTITAGALSKIAASYKASRFALSLNSSVVASILSGTVPAVTRLDIGNLSGFAQFYNGWIPALRYYSQSLTASELQAFSK